ncbi:hypothetical protein EON83_28425 [bacterium]|nr:MAG: hypothetical protein EON83_28425 [bacterium]
MFIPAHDAVVLYALETASITESTNGTTPANLPTTPTPLGVLGYTNLPQTARGLNNSKGFAIGQQGAAYNKRGRVEPSVSLEIRPGSVAALANLLPDENGDIPYLAIFIVVKGKYTDVYRFCKPSSLDWKFGGGGDSGGGEISISAEFWATAYEYENNSDNTRTIPTSQLRALGTPLMWHDVREFSIGTISYRQALMNLSAKVDYGLERKNERPNWGDNKPLSRTSYALLEHHNTVSGEIGLHARLPETLFSAAANAQNWGDIAINCSDPAGKGFALTLTSAFPSDESMGGGESSAEIDHTVPFTADNIALSLLSVPTGSGSGSGSGSGG